MYTDTCDSAVGAVLEQEGHSVAYISKTLSHGDSHGMSTYEKEIQAILYALKQWWAYLILHKKNIF